MSREEQEMWILMRFSDLTEAKIVCDSMALGLPFKNWEDELDDDIIDILEDYFTHGQG